MRHIFTSLLIPVSSMIFVSGCSSSHSCTQIGCTDVFTLNMSLSSGEKPNISIDLLVDGVAVSCPALDGQTVVACAANVTGTMVQEEDCVQSQQGSAVTQTCTGTGVFHVSVAIAGAPRSVAYTAKLDGAVVGQDTVTPSYRDFSPNGSDCAPSCKQAAVDVTLTSM
jgi:hypothetical protein